MKKEFKNNAEIEKEFMFSGKTLTAEEYEQYRFDKVIKKVDDVINSLKDTESKQLSTLKTVSKILHTTSSWKKYEMNFIEKKCWEGLHNFHRRVRFDMLDFTHYILDPFIYHNYPDVNIDSLSNTKEFEEFQNALENVLDYVKKDDNYNQIVIKIKDEILTPDQRIKLLFDEVSIEVMYAIHPSTRKPSKVKQVLIKALKILMETQPFDLLNMRIYNMFLLEPGISDIIERIESDPEVSNLFSEWTE